ncbi:hypothetical protein WSM22_40770 [Cytophagales bacterium WSM2-2]|nr:hypothetical protein WSM22_40770 [Cytophagales bacterium WSM2-2]
MLHTTRESETLNPQRITVVEQEFDDIIEVSDLVLLKFKLNELKFQEVNQVFSVLEAARKGIILHEMAERSLKWGAREEAYEFARQSLQHFESIKMTSSQELLPIISAYTSSVQMLMAMCRPLFFEIQKVLRGFQQSVNQFKELSVLPEYLRAKACLKLPWYFIFRKRRANKDLNSVILKSHQLPMPYNSRIVSFAYLVMAELKKEESFNNQLASIIALLDKAIIWDPTNAAAREKAEFMKAELLRKTHGIHYGTASGNN